MKTSRKTYKIFNRLANTVLTVLMLAIVGVWFQNCSSPFEAIGGLGKSTANLPSRSGAGAGSGPGETGVNAMRIPASDKIDPNGLTSGNYDTCIFYKNPVATNSQSVGNKTQRSALNEAQTFCAKLTSLNGSGSLTNSFFQIDTLSGEKINTKAINRINIGQDTGAKIEQLNAYYWGTRFTEYIEARTGRNYILNKNIRVITDSAFTGWLSKKNEIHLAKKGDVNSAAFSGEIVVHLLAQAQLHYATDGAINNLVGDSNHKSCGLNKLGCCVSELGCSKAIASGVGDYLAAVMFPDKLGIGEFVTNSMVGISYCGFSRNISSHSTASVMSAFNSCSIQSGVGQVNNMGSLYAAIWWQIRNSADPVEIDILFMEHLKYLSAEHTFIDALSKALEADARLYNSKHMTMIRNEFQKKGLM